MSGILQRMFLAKVFISLKPTVSDPQGQTIQDGLHQLGFSEVRSLRVGKYIEILLDGGNERDAAQEVCKMCDKLLANPVMEDYRIDIEEVTNSIGRVGRND